MEVTNPLIEIRRHRNRFTRTNARLKRARRLYCRCLRSAFAKDRTGEVLRTAAKRAQAAGIYSENTALRDVMQSISTHLHRYEKANGQHRSWFGWMRANGWDTCKMIRFSKSQNRYRKPWEPVNGFRV